MNKVKIIFFFDTLLALALFIHPVFAQGQEPPTGDGWGEVINSDGSIRFDNLSDMGEIQVAVSWMPDIPFVDGQASYHQYATPSGAVVVLPSATTLFFMSMNPEASGINQAHSFLGNSVGYWEMMLAGYITPGNISDAGYTNPDDFYQSVIDGNTDIWTFDFMGNFLWDLMTMSLSDENLYSLLLLYPPGTCESAPGGCPPQVATPVPPTNAVCPAPFITTEPIIIKGGSAKGGMIAPPYPVVVGQDPERRGVDVEVHITIPPVVYHTFERRRHDDLICSAVSGGGNGCPDHPHSPYFTTHVRTWYECVEHTRIYPDNLASARVSINLTQDSRQYILTHLSEAYPDAHLIHPDFTFLYGPGGSLWSQIIPNIQVADPGDYTVTVMALTTGTPVSAPRMAQIGLGIFPVELVRVTLIDQP
jgi:hypothetical protein